MESKQFNAGGHLWMESSFLPTKPSSSVRSSSARARLESLDWRTGEGELRLEDQIFWTPLRRILSLKSATLNIGWYPRSREPEDQQKDPTEDLGQDLTFLLVKFDILTLIVISFCYTLSDFKPFYKLIFRNMLTLAPLKIDTNILKMYLQSWCSYCLIYLMSSSTLDIINRVETFKTHNQLQFSLTRSQHKVTFSNKLKYS